MSTGDERDGVARVTFCGKAFQITVVAGDEEQAVGRVQNVEDACEEVVEGVEDGSATCHALAVPGLVRQKVLEQGKSVLACNVHEPLPRFDFREQREEFAKFRPGCAGKVGREGTARDEVVAGADAQTRFEAATGRHRPSVAFLDVREEAIRVGVNKYSRLVFIGEERLHFAENVLGGEDRSRLRVRKRAVMPSGYLRAIDAREKRRLPRSTLR